MSASELPAVGRRVTVLDDEHIARTLDPASAVAWMREAVIASASGAMSSPARIGVPLDDGRMVFTVGGLRDT